MDIFKIAGIGIAAAVFAVFIKGWRPELAIQVSLIATIIILAAVLPYLKVVADMLRDIIAQADIESKYIGIVLKIVGIAYIAQFASELCRDAGEGAIASKIEIAGKIIIMTMSMPIIYSLLEVVNEIIRFE